jgi:uncharacterized RDD family membrane protein YckC
MDEARRTLRYAGFWRRLLSLLTDFAVLIPSIIVSFRFGYASPAARVACTVGMAVLWNAYNVFFLTRWGQTLGKMAAGIRVTRPDGRRIGARQAWLRCSVDIGLGVLACAGTLYVCATWAEPAWSTTSRRDLVRLLAERDPLLGIVQVASQVWGWSELVVLLMNKKRRALHDYLAGTVVIRVDDANPAAAELR